MSKRRFLLSAIFAAGVLSAPTFAGEMEILNEEDLDEVSAQGLQLVTNNTRPFDNVNATINGQNNNLDSVQLNDNAQSGLIAAALINMSKTALNVGINILFDGPSSDPVTDPPPMKDDPRKPPDPPPMDKTFSDDAHQKNEQVAKNHDNTANDEDYEERIAWAFNIDKQRQDIKNGTEEGGPTVVVDQDNNNNSVQLNDNALSGAAGLILDNDAISAVNIGMNIFVGGNLDDTHLEQENEQTARNMSNYAESGLSEGSAIAENRETDTTQRVTNSYGSDIYDQDNNNNSVQLNDNAESGAAAIAMLNIANSAYNHGLNIAVMNDVTDSDIEQENEQMAQNHVNEADADGDASTAIARNDNKQKQAIHTSVGQFDGELDLIAEQDNNNNSVQLNDSAQAGAMAVDMTNAAMSAGNFGLNLMASGPVTDTDIEQENEQTAENFLNRAEATETALAYNSNNDTSEEPGGQYVHNVHATIQDQNNNNNSVQLNDDAQSGIRVISGVNMAQSAVNVGMNILFVNGDMTDSDVEQENEQTAENHNNYATAASLAKAVNFNKQKQVIENCFCSDLSQTDQDNNMNSVQLNDNAQAGAAGWSIVNAAASAGNIGTNIAIVTGSVMGSEIHQTNTQTAINFSNVASGETAIAGNAETPFSF